MCKIILEICAYSVEWAVAAESAGADRIEICASPLDGGVTPSYGMIDAARRALHIPLHVIIRPRGGDFLYSAAEFEVMKSDIRICKQLGAHGVVLGILLPDGEVDKERCIELVELAKPMSVTFHRAFDMASSAEQALEDVIATGCHRILTSGSANTALEGSPVIAQLVQQAGERIVIMPGSGVRAESLRQLIDCTGAVEFHSSARKVVESGMLYRNSRMTMHTSATQGEYDLHVVDRDQLVKMRQLANQRSLNHN